MPEVKVTLLIPGYTVVGTQNPADVDPAHEYSEPKTDARLNWLDGQVHMPWQAQLCGLLGLSSEKGDTLPIARFAGHRLSSEQGIVCAAPIHLKADRDTASLIPAQQLGLTDTEADKLIASVNEFVKEDGFELRRDTASDWYMTGLDGQDLQSFPPSFLAHRNASAFLPDGENSGHWRRLMTEIQMLLHTHPVNTQRESFGKLPINSLWFWGGAPLPDLSRASETGDKAKSVRIYTEDCYAISLSRHMQAAHDSMSEFDALLSSGNSVQDNSRDQLLSDVVLIDTSVMEPWLRGDESGALEAKNVIDSRWIHPLIRQVELGHCRELKILTEDGQHALCNKDVLHEHARNVAAARPSWWKRVLARFQ